MQKRKMTNSELTAFRKCKRYHYFRYEVLARPAMSREVLRIGTAAHKGFNAYWQRRVEYPHDPLRWSADVDFSSCQLSEEKSAMVRALLHGYTVNWNQRNFLPTHVEKKFEIPLIDPVTGKESSFWTLGGSIDVSGFLVYDDGRKQPAFIEHKTTSFDAGEDSLYRMKLELNSQIDIYQMATEVESGEKAFCVYDVARKPSSDRKMSTPEEKRKYVTDKITKETRLDKRQRETDEPIEEFESRLRETLISEKDKYYNVFIVPRSEKQKQEALFDTVETLKEMHRYLIDKKPTPRNTGACEDKFGLCDYLPVCMGKKQITDQKLYRIARTRHEELEDSVESKDE